MGKRKTISEYVTQISDIHTKLQEYPDNETLRKRLDTQLRGWVNKLEVTVFVAQNEQTPWTAEELGYQVRPMLKKSQIGIDQVGDYQFFYRGGDVAGWGGLLVERKGGSKGPEDLYGTLMNRDNRERFYREIDRFQADSRFSQMVVITECDEPEFLQYVPLCQGKRRNVNHVGASVASRRGTIASLYVRGVPVLFAGSRKQAVEMYRSLVRQWLVKNYATILGLDKKPYEDVEYLKTRKAMLEAELLSVNEALGVVA